MSMAGHTADKKAFRLSMLIYDTRYRSITIQLIALIALILVGAWLVNNTLNNLEALDKELGFGFLSEPSSYDINQRLIEYDSRSTHGRAAIVGILNTLLVAFMGCVLATVIGVTAGIARLSKNWIIARLMTTYVEMFRNIPVLLWIVLIMAVVIESLPVPRSFKGDNAISSMLFGDSVAITNRGVYFPKMVLNDGSTMVLTTLALSLVGMWFFGRWAKKRQAMTGAILPTGWIKLGIFAIPTLIVFTIFSLINQTRDYSIVTTSPLENGALAGIERPLACVVGGSSQSVILQTLLRESGQRVKIVEFGSTDEAKAAYSAGECNVVGVSSGEVDSFVASLGVPSDSFVASTTYTHGTAITLSRPHFVGFNFIDGYQMRNSLIALWLALSFYHGAFIAETVRAGILAVSKGQSEAAAALGLRPKRVMNLVVLPQALRVMIPPMISHFLSLTKNSSLAIVVGYMDITATLGGITLNQTGREMESLLLLMAMYLSISITVSVIMNWYNESIKMRER